MAQDVIADSPPIITNFAVQLVSGTTYEFEGQVTTTYPAGLVVTFGGVPLSSQGQTATVSAAGTFDVTINMSNGALDNGLATAEIFADAWGLSSNTAVTQINVT